MRPSLLHRIRGGGGETNRLLDLYGAENEDPSENKEDHSRNELDGDEEARTLYEDIPQEELLDEIELSTPPKTTTLRRSARINRIQARHARDISSRTQTERASTGIADFDMLSSDTTKFGLDIISGELIDARGYLSAGLDDFNQGRLEDKYIARVLVKARP